MLNLILYLLAAICFAAATLNVGARINLVAAGLLCWVLIPLIGTARAQL